MIQMYTCHERNLYIELISTERCLVFPHTYRCMRHTIAPIQYAGYTSTSLSSIENLFLYCVYRLACILGCGTAITVTQYHPSSQSLPQYHPQFPVPPIPPQFPAPPIPPLVPSPPCQYTPYLADSILRHQHISCCQVTVYEAFGCQVMHTKGHLLAELQQHSGPTRRCQVLRPAQKINLIIKQFEQIFYQCTFQLII